MFNYHNLKVGTKIKIQLCINVLIDKLLKNVL